MSDSEKDTVLVDSVSVNVDTEGKPTEPDLEVETLTEGEPTIDLPGSPVEDEDEPTPELVSLLNDEEMVDREAALAELVRLHQEMGLYDESVDVVVPDEVECDTDCPSISFDDQPLEEIRLHEHGVVRLLNVMGSDREIEQAARQSYDEQDTNRTEEETRRLLRYLMKHKHTSPFEMGVVRFHLVLPIFVMRQLVRHRTASLNEYSGRYTKMMDEKYVPELDYIKAQSTTNKQGREGELRDVDKEQISHYMGVIHEKTQKTYDWMLEQNLSRELARTVLPVAGYTKCVWQINLHNFFHFLKLRTDSHAQQEIQDYANAMLELVEPHFPISFEAWRDYGKDAKTLSRLELNALSDFIKDGMLTHDHEKYGMSKREFKEFRSWIEKLKQN